MKRTKLNREIIVGKFGFIDSERLEAEDTGDSIDIEELSGIDCDTLQSTLCGNTYKPIEFYTKLIKKWGAPDDVYDLILSDEDENIQITTEFRYKGKEDDSIYIYGKNGFKPSDIYNIIDSINCQSQFYDLFIAFESDEIISSSIYHGESFAVHKQWIDVLMTKFRQGELDKYHHITITSDFESLCVESNDDCICDNRLYVMFEG